MSTSIEITEDITQVNVTEDVTTINITPAITSVEVKGVSIATTSATGMGTAHAVGSRFTSVTVQGSLNQASTGLDSVSATAVASFVDVTGDTMTGELIVPRLKVERDNGTAVITLHDNTDDDDHIIYLTGLVDGVGGAENIFSLGTNDLTNQFQMHSWQNRDFEFTFGSNKHVDSVATISTSRLNVAGTITSTGNIVTSGNLHAPSSFTIDPATVGDNTGTVVIAGDLQVQGTTTTVDSTTVNIADKNIELGYNATTDLQNDGAGITVSRPESTDATITWDETNDRFAMTNGLYLEGDIKLNGFPESTYEVKGDIDGGIRFHSQADEDVAKGDIVYISGASGANTLIRKARADSASTMPAFGLCLTAATSGSQVQVVSFGNLYGTGTPAFRLDTSAYDAGTELYVSDTEAGVWTNQKPAGESNLIQQIGKVVRSSATNGVIKVGGAGRTNAISNLNEGNIFIGSASGRAVTSSLSSEFTSRFNTAITSTTTSIQTASSNAATKANSVSTQAAARVSTVSAVAAANASAIDTVSAAAVANESRLNSMSTTVVSNTSRVNTLSSTVAAIDTATVSSNAATARSALSGRIDTNSAAIAGITSYTDGARVDSLSTAVALNTAKISYTDEARVDSLSTAVVANTAKVSYTDGAVQTYLDGGTASATLSAVRLNSVHIHTTALSGTEFKALYGSRIVKNGGVDITYGSFQPAAADVGKTWTIINASASDITLDWDGQYVHVMNGSETVARKTDWQLTPGAVVDIICIDSAANGGSTSTEPNFVIYGTGIVDI